MDLDANVMQAGNEAGGQRVALPQTGSAGSRAGWYSAQPATYRARSVHARHYGLWLDGAYRLAVPLHKLALVPGVCTVAALAGPGLVRDAITVQARVGEGAKRDQKNQQRDQCQIVEVHVAPPR